VTKRELQSRYRKAARRVKRETLIVERARDRRDYWSQVKKNLEVRLKLASEGQLELPL
jgi:hypothetical protein